MKAVVRVWLHEHERDYIYHLKKILCTGLKKTFILIELKTYTLTKFVSKKKKKKKKKIGYEINHSSSFCCDGGMGVFCSPSFVS